MANRSLRLDRRRFLQTMAASLVGGGLASRMGRAAAADAAPSPDLVTDWLNFLDHGNPCVGRKGESDTVKRIMLDILLDTPALDASRQGPDRLRWFLATERQIGTVATRFPLATSAAAGAIASIGADADVSVRFASYCLLLYATSGASINEAFVPVEHRRCTPSMLWWHGKERARRLALTKLRSSRHHYTQSAKGPQMTEQAFDALVLESESGWLDARTNRDAIAFEIATTAANETALFGEVPTPVNPVEVVAHPTCGKVTYAAVKGYVRRSKNVAAPATSSAAQENPALVRGAGCAFGGAGSAASLAIPLTASALALALHAVIRRRDRAAARRMAETADDA